ncbi:InlB B-repeat-containing protein [Breznakiellaceae bacterium SP9]
MKRKLTVIVLCLLQAGLLAAQSAVTIEDALARAAQDFGNTIPAVANTRTKVLVLHVKSPTEALQAYINRNLAANLAKNPTLSSIEERNRPSLAEFGLNLGVELSDTQARSIGSRLGMAVVITGYAEPSGGGYALQLKSIRVSDGRVLLDKRYNLRLDNNLRTLTTPPAVAAPSAPAPIAPAPSPVYTVTIGALSHGSITGNPLSGAAGTRINLIVSPEAGYRLKANGLKYNDGTDHAISGNSFTLPAANVLVSADFELIPPTVYTVTIRALSHGSITASAMNGAAGTRVNLTVSPETGYRLKANSLKYNDGTDHAISGNSFTLPAANVLVSADFELIPPTVYTVTIGALSHGSITGNPLSGAAGTKINLIVSPEAGYRLKANGLKYNDGTDHAISGNSFTLPTANVLVSADFELIPPTVYTVTIGALSHGSITGNPLSGAAGTRINLIVSPEAGYRLKANGLKYNDGTDHAISGNSFTLPAANVLVSADFELIPAPPPAPIAPAAPAKPVPAPAPAVSQGGPTGLNAAVGLYVDNTFQTAFDLYDALDWITLNAKQNGNYTIVLGKDEKVSYIPIAYKVSGVRVTLRGSGGNRKITFDIPKPTRALFTVGNGATFVLDEQITLTGLASDSKHLVVVDGGTFILNGGTISGNKISGYGAGVYMNSGTFTMLNGTISGNTSNSDSGNTGGGGGVYVASGTFNMNGGTISGNTTTNVYGGGGGVYVESSGTFNMNGGTISGNTSSGGYGSGGGVYVSGSAVFTKSGTAGIIYGSNASADQANKATRGAHAVYANNGYKVRNTTARAATAMTTNQSGAAGGWE